MDSEAGGSVPSCATINLLMMKRKTFIILMTAGVLLCSCSVKEDRTPCPCWLDVFFDAFPKEGVSLAGYGSQRIFSDELDEKPYTGYREYEVQRTFISVSAYRMLEGIDGRSGSALIEKGNQADSLYAHLSSVNCTGEFAVDTVRLHKQFATVYLTFENTEGITVSYTPVITGNVCGMDLKTLRPLEGEFEYEPSEAGPLFYTFRIPRQKDSSLQMELYDSNDGSFIDTVDLGRLIVNSGYDWNARDLKDIVVTVDFAKVEMEIHVSEWGSEDIYDVTI